MLKKPFFFSENSSAIIILDGLRAKYYIIKKRQIQKIWAGLHLEYAFIVDNEEYTFWVCFCLSEKFYLIGAESINFIVLSHAIII